MALIVCQTQGCTGHIDTMVAKPEHDNSYRCAKCGNLSPHVEGDTAIDEARRLTKEITCRCPDCGKGFEFVVGPLGTHPAELPNVMVECSCMRRRTSAAPPVYVEQPFDPATGERAAPKKVEQQRRITYARQWSALELISYHKVSAVPLELRTASSLFNRR